MAYGLAESLRTLSHLFLPVRCTLCDRALSGDPIPFFCRACWGRLTPLPQPNCPRCGRPFGSSIAIDFTPDWQCDDCHRHPPAYEKAWSCNAYESPLKDAIHLFKYRRKVALAAPLAGLLLTRAAAARECDLVVPVPLHPDRLRDREFNQSLLLADLVARHLKIPLSYDTLVRTRPAPAQSELSRAERLKNLRKTFAVERPQLLQDKRILLIDDVYTTGTTVNECAKALRKAGAGSVFVCTLARAL